MNEQADWPPKMDNIENATIQSIIDDLARNIAIAKSQSCDLAARLLDMARIELLARHHGIHEHELKQFCKTIESRAKRAASAIPSKPGTSGRRTSSRRSTTRKGKIAARRVAG